MLGDEKMSDMCLGRRMPCWIPSKPCNLGFFYSLDKSATMGNLVYLVTQDTQANKVQKMIGLTTKIVKFTMPSFLNILICNTLSPIFPSGHSK